MHSYTPIFCMRWSSRKASASLSVLNFFLSRHFIAPTLCVLLNEALFLVTVSALHRSCLFGVTLEHRDAKVSKLVVVHFRNLTNRAGFLPSSHLPSFSQRAHTADTAPGLACSVSPTSIGVGWTVGPV